MMRSRTSAMDGGSLLDPLYVLLAPQDMLHENPGRDDVVGIDLAGLDQPFHFGNRRSRGSGHHRIEIARRAPVDEIPGPVADPRLHEREVGAQWLLEDVGGAV